MNMGPTVERSLHFKTGRHSRKRLQPGSAKPALPKGRVPRVARLMALAIKFDQLLRDGTVKDQAELARVGHVTRARITQIMDLLNLSPRIQEAVLFLPMENGRSVITERSLRPIAAVLDWREQLDQRFALDFVLGIDHAHCAASMPG